MPRVRPHHPTVHRTPDAPQELSLVRLGRHLGRAALRRCPNCGSGGLFRRWLLMRDVCPGCDLRLDRGESDYYIGSFTVNLVTAELMICALGLAGILMTWPDVPWDALKWGLMGAMVPLPAFFYPFAKTLWLGVDLTFRPPTLNDFAGHGENFPSGGEIPTEALPSFPPGLPPR